MEGVSFAVEFSMVDQPSIILRRKSRPDGAKHEMLYSPVQGK